MNGKLPRGVFRALRLGGFRRAIDDELADHFMRVEEELVRAGMDRQEAVREARRRFGDVRKWRRRMESFDRAANRRQRTGNMIGATAGAVGNALRGLRAWPGLSLAVILAFGLGIGANATVYGILDRLLLSPPAHLSEPDGVVRLLVERSFGGQKNVSETMSLLDVVDFEASDRFAEVAAFSRMSVTVGRGEEAEPVRGSAVTADFFSLVGVQPHLGRFFTEQEDRAGGDAVVVLGHGYWQRAFASRRDVLGETIDFGQGPYTIVGVAPRGFTGIDLAPVDLWLPMYVASAAILGGPQWLESRNAYFASAVARLEPGVTPQMAELAATQLHRNGRREQIETQRYDPEVRVLATSVIAARGPEPDQEVGVAKWLAGVSAVVLLIACINVANLLLARSLRRRRETSIRMALGVSRARLVGDAIADGLLLATLGAVAAVGAAHWGGQIIRSMLLPDVDWSGFAMGAEVVGFIAILAIVAGLVSAVVPAIQATRADVNDALRASAGGITRSTLRARGVLSMAQAALSVMLLVGAGLFVRSLRGVTNLDLGLDTDGLLIAHILTERSGFEAADRRAFFDRGIVELSRLPVVRDVAHGTATPFWDARAFSLRVPGLDSIPRHPRGGPYSYSVTPGFFQTMGIRIESGRALADTDRRGAPAVVVINRAMASLIWPGEDALGRCIHINISEDNPDAPCAEVVGIAEDSRRGGIREEPTPQYFVAAAQELIPPAPNVFYVRTSGNAQEHAAAIRSALLALEPRLRYVNVRPLADLMQAELRPFRLGATLFTAFGIIALAVAALGLYSVLAFDVAQRIREIGLRSALGADIRNIIGLVVSRAVAITTAGIGLGLVGALLLAPRLESLLFGIGPRDPATFAGVVILLLAIAGIASAIPAWRAARVDPNIALRAD